MTVVRFILIMLAVYFLYRFIFHFLIPVYQASRKIRQQFRNMQEQAQDNIRANQHTYSGPVQGQAGEPVKANPKDYIDFEEVKE